MEPFLIIPRGLDFLILLTPNIRKDFNYELFCRSFEAWQRGILYSVVDSHVYGNVLFDLGVVFLLPCWTIIYLINMAEVNCIPKFLLFKEAEL